ncbi:MAG TPA: VOC family protein [Myxococcota bacterium]|nr:VOC family protein [Myxococcota bacterium]
MQAPKVGRVQLPPIDQVGFVVRDARAVAKAWEPFFGPFEFLDSPMQGVIYRGQPTDCRVLLALAHPGPIEIELIEVLEGRTIHSEALEQGRTGPHHLRCRVDDIDASLRALQTEGLRPVWGQRFSDEVAFWYLEGLEDLYLELIEWKLPPGVMP